MDKDFVEMRLFNNGDLTYFESAIQREITDLLSKIEKLNADLIQRRETLSKIQKLKHGSGNAPKSEQDELAGIIFDILMELREPLSLKQILQRYKELKGKEPDREELFACLQRHRGTIFEIIGQRGGAKWSLIEKSDK